MNSREKGKRGELELAHYLQENGYTAIRGQQYSGINGDADVVGLPGIHIECKRVESGWPGAEMEKAIAQSKRDAYAESLKEGRPMIPTVWHRKNRTKWKVTMDADDFMELYRRVTWT